MRVLSLSIITILIGVLAACDVRDPGPSESDIRADLLPIERDSSPENAAMVKQLRDALKISITERLTAPSNELQTITVAVTKDAETYTYKGQYRRYKEGWRLAGSLEPDAETKRRQTVRTAIAEAILLASSLKTLVAEEYSNDRKWSARLPNVPPSGAVQDISRVDAGAILIQFRNHPSVGYPLDGKFITLTPRGDDKTGLVTWTCKANFDEKLFLPEECK